MRRKGKRVFRMPRVTARRLAAWVGEHMEWGMKEQGWVLRASDLMKYVSAQSGLNYQPQLKKWLVRGFDKGDKRREVEVALSKGKKR